ncbi:CRTAC1 family protein [Acidipila rosea]|uniref:VCBS repeat protein n=1 Tax=Acidipila rosea TaxID=768535 RepID=A0A4R1L6K1_9BACT|nr:CRTAC1 family protein [Acidipila rosea]MBW4026210.1 CRTAC1 family protein [Acidobacteriota bacterium]MBW4044654.1 CRTAC1 family protein [Acidobacteriota bacterium]TCK72827.1 VCBS repeat protein [Acidipila rosea]
MKPRRSAKFILALFFVALLFVPFVLQRRDTRHAAAQGAISSATALARYGFYFDEVSKQAGINFIHEAPTLDPRLDAIMPEVASMGASVSIVDFDRDGWPDLYVTNSAIGSRNHLYRNMHDGTFQDVAEKMGVADVNRAGTGVSMGAVWGDYDNDGYEDMFLIKWGKPELFHNDHGHGFTQVGDEAGLPPWINANTAVWFDYDGDGKLDLFVGGYYPENVNLWKLDNTRMMPESFEYAKNGGRKYLFHNLGNGKFEEVSQKVGITSRRWALAAAAADLRGTGRQDLFIANDYGVSELFLNDGGRFHEAGQQTGVGAAPKSGMNAAFGDIFDQGKYSIYVSNISEEGVLIQGNNLWVPDESAPKGSLRYTNMARDMGVELGGWSFGAQFGDLNNDGNLDLYLVNGYVSLDRSKSYWYDFTKIAGGNSTIIDDAKNWPAMKGRSLSGYQQKKVWLNDGEGKFEDVARAVGVADTHDGRSVAMADLWNRGVLDVVVANQRGPLLVYKNHVKPGNRWIEFALEGTRSNRSAIGAEVTVYWNGKQQIQQVSGGSGFAAQNDRRLHFGLGPDAQIDKAVIRWPSGTKQVVHDLAPDKLYHILEAK